MVHYRYRFQYRDQLIRNRERILQYLSEPSEEALYRLLTRYGCSIGKKLLWILEYFENYDMQISFHDARGIEMACSFDYMVSRAGGSKETWRKTILMLCALGLLRQFRPRLDSKLSYANTPAQQYSAKRVVGEKRYPVTWYSVPVYTDDLMAFANERASTFMKYRSGLDKDCIRFELGAREANRICDTGYPKSPWRAEMEKALYKAITEQIERRGYTILSDVLEAAQRRTWRSRNDILSTWKSYRHELEKRFGIQYGRPTTHQKAAFNLESDKWIITQQPLSEDARTVNQFLDA